MRKNLLLLVFVVAGAPVFAQQSVAEAAAQAKARTEGFSPDAPTHDQVMTLLDLLQIRKRDENYSRTDDGRFSASSAAILATLT